MDAPPDLPAAKAAIRTAIRQRLRELDPARLSEQSSGILRRIQSLEAWQTASTLLGFLPRPDEPDIRPLLTDWLDQGRTLLLPAYDPATAAYGVRQVSDLEGQLLPGRYRIPEPDPDACPAADRCTIGIALVPGLAFSPAGVRLGRGRGFYDRLLEGCGGRLIGVAFEEQVVDDLPEEPHDHRMDLVVTPGALFSGRRS